MIMNPVSVNAVQVSEDTGVRDQYSGESERVETNGGVAEAGPGSVVTRDGYRLVFIRYRYITDTFKTIPVPKQCRNRYFYEKILKK